MIEIANKNLDVKYINNANDANKNINFAIEELKKIDLEYSGIIKILQDNQDTLSTLTCERLDVNKVTINEIIEVLQKSKRSIVTKAKILDEASSIEGVI